ncbi:hypothetical protein [Poseidonibacter sp.]|uniref:hypothetical protein n=1 Tax=Poseidonibacter sp. TaxID=2321188 RepID=UPI003C70AB74
MTKIDYKKNISLLEDLYIQKLFSTNFGNGKNAKTVEEKFNDLKIRKPFDDIFKNINFKDLILSTPDKLKELIRDIESNSTEEQIIELKEVFDYKKFQPFISSFFEEEIQIKTCSFCNIHFVNEYKDKNNSYKNEFTLDHYYDKATYPYLALSLYNLIPSCYTCNSKLKKNEEFKNIAPSSDNFDFDEKVKFNLYLDKSFKNLHIKDKENIDIELKEYYSNDYDKYIKIFKLNERYKAHKDIVYDMITKAELYPQCRLKELQDLTGIPFQQIKKDIFNLIDENEDLSKKPFSKLIKDISEELKLI